MLLDLLFPKFCAGCNRIGSYICNQCQKTLSIVRKDTCLYCSSASYLGLTHFGCKRSRGIDGGLSVFHYNTMLKKIMKAIKYRSARRVADELFHTIPVEFLYKLQFFKTLQRPVVLQSIPLSLRRLKVRGFNQADLWRDYLITFMKEAEIITSLERVKDTLPQAMLPGKNERYNNMRGAFRLAKDTPNPDVSYILLDDVVTTGSTAKEACSILKSKGAQYVYFIAIARG